MSAPPKVSEGALPRKLTQPCSPKFATSRRASVRGAATAPRPFKLASAARHELASEARERRQREEDAEALRLRSAFRARPVRVSEGWMPRKSVGKEAVTPRPFALRTEARGELTQERAQEKVRQQQQHEDELRHFHARSAGALKTPAFCATKSLKPLTEMEHVTSGRRERWRTPPYPHHTPPHPIRPHPIQRYPTLPHPTPPHGSATEQRAVERRVWEKCTEAERVEKVLIRRHTPLFPICRTPFPPYVRN